MAEEKDIYSDYSDGDASGTWAVVGLVLGVIIVAVSLYFGGVFGHMAGDQPAQIELHVDAATPKAAR